MEFGFPWQWLLIGLPAAFLLGWLASRLDLRQLQRQRRDAPRAYFEGLDLLLNDQQDKAIDAFIEAVQLDPDTTGLHFGLGNLFRRRGEFERAVRVHQHLLSRAEVKPGDHARAQHALAQDFMKAGLFDRAEAAWQALRGTPFDGEAQLALLSLHERSRDWASAIEVATRLQASGSDALDARIAHYHCELALDADAQGRTAEADRAIVAALQAAPASPHALLLLGERAARAQRPADALAAWDSLRAHSPRHFALIAEDYAQAALQVGRQAPAQATLQRAYDEHPGFELLRALKALDDAGDAERVLAHLQRQPSLAGAAAVLAIPAASWHADTQPQLHSAVQRADAPLQRYRCAVCGFEARTYFWQCPGCQGWDTYPPEHLDSAEHR